MTKFRSVALMAAIGMAGLATACMDDTPVGPDSTAVTQVASAQAPVSMDLMARGLAIALADDAFRMQILEDMRDSPFPKHSLHLTSYLSGARGQSIMAAIGGQLGKETGQFASALTSGENIAFYVNPAAYRMTWEGDADLAVLPLFEGALDADGLVVGYRPGGVQVSVDIYAQSTFPAFLLGLSTIDFGPNPESQRASAPKHGRPTISTPEEEFGGGLSATMSSFMGGDCDPESTVPCECQIDLEGTPPEGCAPCELDPESCEEEEPAYEPSPPIQRGFHVHGTESCFWHPPLLAGYNDADLDGVFDSCENALAVAMAPRLGLHPAELDASREPYFAAITVGAGIVAVFYALSYHWDMGNPLGTAGGHPGDSEFVIVTVQDEGNGYWSRKGIYTAAHEGTPGESSRWWGPVEYPAPYVPTRPLAPTVYVAVNKHASYGSVLGCEQGGTFFTFGSLDHCASNGPQEDVTAHHHANLGSSRSPIRDCVPSIAGYPGFECFWTGSYFLGWTGEEASTTAYSQHLVPRGF